MNSKTKNSVSTENKKTDQFRIITVIATILLIGSTVLNVLLSQKVRYLTDALNEVESQSRLNEGEDVPLLEAKDLTGNPVTIAYSETNQPTVLYIFTPQCRWCFENLDNIKTLANETHGKYRLIGLSLNKAELNAYVEKTKLNFPVYTDIPSAIELAYKFGGTPQTLVISPEGKVVKNWVGIYTGDVASEVESYFKVNLPEIAQKESRARSDNENK